MSYEADEKQTDRIQRLAQSINRNESYARSCFQSISMRRLGSISSILKAKKFEAHNMQAAQLLRLDDIRMRTHFHYYKVCKVQGASAVSVRAF